MRRLQERAFVSVTDARDYFFAGNPAASHRGAAGFAVTLALGLSRSHAPTSLVISEGGEERGAFSSRDESLSRSTMQDQNVLSGRSVPPNENFSSHPSALFNGSGDGLAISHSPSASRVAGDSSCTPGPLSSAEKKALEELFSTKCESSESYERSPEYWVSLRLQKMADLWHNLKRRKPEVESHRAQRSPRKVWGAPPQRTELEKMYMQDLKFALEMNQKAREQLKRLKNAALDARINNRGLALNADIMEPENYEDARFLPDFHERWTKALRDVTGGDPDLLSPHSPFATRNDPFSFALPAPPSQAKLDAAVFAGCGERSWVNLPFYASGQVKL